MFGLMTVARHEREMAEAREAAARWFDTVTDALTNATAADRNTAHWRALAEKMQSDMADLMKRQAPPVPGPDESVEGAIADEEWTPSAIAKRERAVGAKS